MDAICAASGCGSSGLPGTTMTAPTGRAHAQAASVGQAFNALPAEDRRPVEVLGLLHLVMSLDPDIIRHGVEQYDAELPDGTPFPLMVPRIVPDPGTDPDPDTEPRTDPSLAQTDGRDRPAGDLGGARG